MPGDERPALVGGEVEALALGIHHSVWVRRLGQVVNGASPQRPCDGREAAEPGNHDNLRCLVEPTQLLDHGGTTAVAQAHLEHGESEGPLRCGCHRRAAAGHSNYLESACGERMRRMVRLPTSWSASNSEPALGAKGTDERRAFIAWHDASAGRAS